MKYSKLNKSSDRGRLIKRLDKMFSQIISLERGSNCEIHGKICDRVGNMHILSKQAHPRLRFVKENIVRCGWFCGHYWSHHNSDDPRAQFVQKRIIEIYGADYKNKLYEIERFLGQHNSLYLQALEIKFRQELEVLNANRIQPHEGREE